MSVVARLLSVRRLAMVFVSAVVLVVAPSAAALSLGPASGFNLFTTGSTTMFNSDIEGRAAIGGSGMFTNMGFGNKLTAADDSTDNLIINGATSITNGQLYHGNFVTGSAPALSGFTVLNGSSRVESNVIDFAAAQVALNALADAYAAVASNGVVDIPPWNSVTMTGTYADLNIFDIDAAQLAAANTLNFDVPTGSQILVNVSGLTGGMSNMGINLGNATANDVLFNFVDATSLNFSSIDIKGTVLAPRAGVTFNNGQQNGTMIAATIFGNGEYHHVPFNETFDQQPNPDPDLISGNGAVPEPATAGLLLITLAGAVGYAARRRR